MSIVLHTAEVDVAAERGAVLRLLTALFDRRAPSAESMEQPSRTVLEFLDSLRYQLELSVEAPSAETQRRLDLHRRLLLWRVDVAPQLAGQSTHAPRVA